MPAYNEAVWRNGGSSPREVQYDFGSLPPARSSVEAATTPSRWDVSGNARTTVQRKNEMRFDNNILKINRHLFDKGTSKINRVLRNFVPRGSNPHLLLVQIAYKNAPACEAENEKVKDRAKMLKLKMSLQDKRYRLGNLFKLNLSSLFFGVLYLFNSKSFKTI
jgi:hypothetical protein